MFRNAESLTPEHRVQARLRRQWVVQPQSDAHEFGWRSHPLIDDYVLRAHTDLRIQRFEGNGGGVLFLIGIAVDPTTPNNQPQFQPQQLQSFEHVVDAVIPLAGTYAVVWHDQTTLRLLTDPAAMMTVYHKLGRASSSIALLPDVHRDPIIDEQYRFQATDDWYTGSLTPYTGVKSVIANHWLDVRTGETARFWPCHPAAPMEATGGIDHAGDLLRRIMHGFIDLDSAVCLVSITGGRDSRVCLAAARQRHGDVSFFTIRNKFVKQCDLQLPALLADRFALHHRFVDGEPAPAWIFELYDEISADMARGARRDILGACMRLAGSNHVHINGNLGALTKSFFWDCAEPKAVKVASLAKEFVQKPPCIMAGIEEWLSTVPDLPPTEVYNLMYLEQRGGRWMGVGEMAANLFYDSVTPFCSRQLFEVMNGLPVQLQRNGALLIEFVRRLWPELLTIPYCKETRSWGGFLPKRLKHTIRKCLWHP